MLSRGTRHQHPLRWPGLGPQRPGLLRLSLPAAPLLLVAAPPLTESPTAHDRLRKFWSLGGSRPQLNPPGTLHLACRGFCLLRPPAILLRNHRPTANVCQLPDTSCPIARQAPLRDWRTRRPGRFYFYIHCHTCYASAVAGGLSMLRKSSSLLVAATALLPYFYCFRRFGFRIKSTLCRGQPRNASVSQRWAAGAFFICSGPQIPCCACRVAGLLCGRPLEWLSTTGDSRGSPAGVSCKAAPSARPAVAIAAGLFVARRPSRLTLDCRSKTLPR
jgi:hypothetical protein